MLDWAMPTRRPFTANSMLGTNPMTPLAVAPSLPLAKNIRPPMLLRNRSSFTNCTLPMTDEENESVADNDAFENEEAVNRALKYSAAVLGIGLAGTLVWFLWPQPDGDAGAVEPPAAILPEERVLPTLTMPLIPFSDQTESAGIDFVHENGAEGEKLLPETMGGGGAFFDFDSDGDQDILCVNSTTWPQADGTSGSTATSALYKNDGTGRFTNVTAGSGLDVPGIYGNGVACGDFDNDGLVDLYVTAVGANVLYRNAGGGHFENVTDAANVAGDDWSTSAGWFDYDLDGDLDLFVCNYVDWSPDVDRSMEFTLTGDLRAYGRPTDFPGAFPVLYRNDGNGQFTDVSESAGIRITDPGTGQPLTKSLGLTFAYVDDDERLDVIIANDTVPNVVLLNQPDGTFLESGASCGIAFDNDGSTRGAMGIDAAWFRNSDALGITIGNFANEMTALYVCQTPGSSVPIFRDEAVSNGIGPVTRTELTFGVLFTDLDLDGRQDIVACNGHLEEDIQVVQSSQHYEQPPQLLWNCGADHENEFIAVDRDCVGDAFLQPIVGRGATRADMDGDGDTDLLLLTSGGRPRLLRNDQETGHHWLRVALQGTRSNRDAIGARVELTLNNGTTLRQVVMPTCSYQSQVERTLTFGLGEQSSIGSLRVIWPGGQAQAVTVDAVDQTILIPQAAE